MSAIFLTIPVWREVRKPDMCAGLGVMFSLPLSLPCVPAPGWLQGPAWLESFSAV